MARTERNGWLRRLLTEQAGRNALLLVANVVNGLIVILNLLGVFDGAPTEVWVAVFAVEILFVGPVLAAVLIFTLRDRAARRRGEPKDFGEVVVLRVRCSLAGCPSSRRMRDGNVSPPSRLLGLPSGASQPEGASVYVVFTVVQIDSGKLPEARQMLEAQLIPGVKQAPGFAKGIWFGDDQSGHGVVVFESREQAEQVRRQLNSVVAEGMKVVDSAVYEVHAEA